MSVIKVAMVTHAYIPLIGGAERMIATLGPALQSLDVQVHVITRRSHGLPAYENISGVPVHRLWAIGPKPTASLSFTVSALRLIKQLAPDIVHAHIMFSPATTAVAAKKMLGSRVAVTAHRSGPLGDVQRLEHKVLGTKRIAIFRKYVDAFVSISTEIDGELDRIGIPSNRRFFIPNAVDTQQFAPPIDKQGLRKQLGFSDGPLVIFAGRLAPEKRLDQLISIWPAIHQMYPKARLIILGAGPQEQQLRQMATDSVEFRGCTLNVAPYLQASDIFVLPSLAEGLSVSLLEAMSTGLAAVVTRVGGATDVVDHGANGLLVSPHSTFELKAALTMLMADPSLRSELGQKARIRIEKEFSLPVIARRLRGLYEYMAGYKAKEMASAV